MLCILYPPLGWKRDQTMKKLQVFFRDYIPGIPGAEAFNIELDPTKHSINTKVWFSTTAILDTSIFLRDLKHDLDKTFVAPEKRQPGGNRDHLYAIGETSTKIYADFKGKVTCGVGVYFGDNRDLSDLHKHLNVKFLELDIPKKHPTEIYTGVAELLKIPRLSRLTGTRQSLDITNAPWALELNSLLASNKRNTSEFIEWLFNNGYKDNI